MATRCSECNKFVSLDIAEPEVETLDLDDGTVAGNVRLVLECATCGTELLEGHLEFDQDVMSFCDKHANHDEISAEERSIESTERKTLKGIFYGYMLTVYVKCSCGVKLECNFDDEMSQSDMEEV